MPRRKFTREGVDIRREQLIEATLDAIADKGLSAATVRDVAARAGVTQGLIRHYFQTKEELVRESYKAFMHQLTDDSRALVLDGDADPVARLAAFIRGSLSPQVMNSRQVSIWSAFLNLSRRDDQMALVHEETYLAFRAQVELMIADLPGRRDAKDVRQLAIATNAVLDGLWLEGGFYPHGFATNELAEIAITTIGNILGCDFRGTRPGVAGRTEDRKKTA
ncbi:MAG: TetR family transcriptional regulator C-terminal domain-containing protein [Paracoccaceae bacterium]